jgi:hypothetical protein
MKKQLDHKRKDAEKAAEKAAVSSKKEEAQAPQRTPPKEIGGPKGLDPTRYGDWEKKGRCIDF